jgi:hypothetical protein
MWFSGICNDDDDDDGGNDSDHMIQELKFRNK